MKQTLLRLTGALALVVTGLAATSSPGLARSHAPTRSRHVIVVLRVQHRAASTSGRSRAAQRSAYAANRRAESGVMARARRSGARDVHGYGLISAFSATVSASEEQALQGDPAVARVFPDLRLTMGPSLRQRMTRDGTPTARVSRRSKAPVVAPSATTGPICPADPAHPLLEPEALGVTDTAFDDPSTPQAQNIVDGTGVKVAWIADGIDINNPDFIRSDGSHVFVDYQDFSGDGPNAPTGGAEAFGDASAIAAQGRQVHDLSLFVNPAHPLPPGCNIKVRGMAPGASLIGLKVFGNSNSAPTSHFIDAIDYAVTDGADVLNESFGGNPFPDSGTDPITLADNAAIAAGVTVVASTGDAGTTGTVGSPSSDPAVIGVGASTTFQSYIQDTYAGAQLSNHTWVSDNISGLSSGGITQAARTPDLVAPGDLGWALCTPDLSLYSECTSDSGDPSSIQNFGGTSQSSPLTAGAAALVIEAYERSHHGVRPAPALVKRLLTSTATDLGHPAYEQGSGRLNSLAAVRAAQSWHDSHGSPAATGQSLVVDKTQLTAVGRPGHAVKRSVTVRNVSSHAMTVHASTRVLSAPTTIASGDVALDTATAPAYLDSFGISRSFATKTFAVPAGRDRLDVTAAAAASPFALRIILIDPTGAYTAYSIPQGANNWTHVDVRQPVAGTWTAYLALSTSSGFNGPVHVLASTSDFASAKATVSPASFTLAAGASRTETVRVREPHHPSDVSASLQLAAAGGPTTSVPLTERAVVPPAGRRFTDTITGGNGRGFPGLSKFYYLDVPRGRRDLSIGITLSDPNELVLATLSGPDGQVSSYQSNVDPDGTQLDHGIQIYRARPHAGRWVLGLAVTNPASGDAVSSPFSVKVAYGAVKVKGSPPHGRQTRLKAGTPVTVPVKVTNNGTASLAYFVDPRLHATGTLSLAELSGVSQPISLPSSAAPFWLVPTACTSLTDTAAADQPVNLDFFYQSGEPEVYGPHVGNGAQATVRAAQVSPGVWGADVGQVGPFAGPAPSGSFTISASARCRLFDPTVTSSTGDLWQAGVTGQSARAGTFTAHLERDGAGLRHGARVGRATPTDTGPLVLAPGQTGTITVTITPHGPAGTRVKGDLFVDSLDLFTDGGNQLAGLPYSYTIK